MATEEARWAAAASLRTLSHAFAAHDPEDDALAAISETAAELTRRVDDPHPGTLQANRVVLRLL